jgi:hypothetical protein
VLEEANLIYVKKDDIRGDMWRQFPVGDKIRELRERVTRIEAQADRFDDETPERNEALRQAIIDDGLDIINYSVFMIRQLREGIA